ncbi:MAG: hypothetical protein V7704_00415 [Aurantimonas endophytica]|uniref:DUF6894 family protein n=1 Tax=Aurantimonas endophytica TaxID=1522175 RepID=UPI0030014BE4
MPLYYFDIEDQDDLSRDDTGIDCTSRDAIRNAAVDALPDLARDLILGDEHHTIVVLVRDEAGRKIYRASLTVDAAWLDGPER